jgi:hypothetical protein
MRFRPCVVALLPVVFLACYIPCSFAQGGTNFAQLNGTIVAQTGGDVGRATLILREVETNQTYTTTSNEVGFYVVPSVPPGKYDLSVEAPGFAKYTRTGIALTVGQTATIDVALSLATVHEVVEVSGEAPTIEPTRSETSQAIETTQIQSLPINGRQFIDFALLTPGVSTGRTSLQSTFTDPETVRISFGGQRDLNNGVTVDGADNFNSATGSQRATPSQEAVSEFRVVNSSFGAEYGRALGGIVNIVTKSGTNDFHGSLYEYFRNNKLDATSLLTVPKSVLAADNISLSQNVLRQNQYGFTLGGPIKKDRTFFFMNYEGQRHAESPNYPALLFAPSDLNPAASNIQMMNRVKQSYGIAPEDLNILKTNNNDNGFIKIDHEINNKNRVALHYFIEDSRNLNMLVGSTLDGGGVGLPSSGRNGILRDQAVVGTWTTQISSTLLNSLEAQYARRHYSFLGVTGQPNFDMPNLLLLGHNFGAFDATNESRGQFADTLSWVKGKHLAKFGFDTSYVQNYVIWPGFTPARIIYPSLDDFEASSAADVAAGTPCPLPLAGTVAPCTVGMFWAAPLKVNGVTHSVSDPTWQGAPNTPGTWPAAYPASAAASYNVYLNHGYNGFFAQDQWRLNPKFTVNYGLRWDFETGLGKFVNPDYRSFSPRVGFAYSPDSKTVIRGGYGIFYDIYALTFFFISSPQHPPYLGPNGPPNYPYPINEKFPFNLHESASGTWLLDSALVGLPTPTPAGSATPCPGGPNPFYSSYTPFNPGNGCPLASVTVVPNGPIILPNPNGGPPTFLPGVDGYVNQLLTTGVFPPDLSIFQGASDVDQRSRDPYSEQTNLQIERQLGGGLVVNASYLFVAGHKLVRPVDLNVGPAIGTLPDGKLLYNQGLPPNQFQSGGIIYHTETTGNSIYHGGNISVTEKAGSYFQMNANYTFSKTIDDGTYTTFVSTPQSIQQRNLERALSNQDVRHRFVANFVASAPEHTFARNFQLSGIITAQSARPFTLFVGADANGDGNPVTDRVGLSPRNSYRGDKLISADMRLSRTFHIRERMKLQLAAEAFNMLNRPNVDEILTVYGWADFLPDVPVPTHFKDGVTGAKFSSVDPRLNSGFGAPRTVFNPRQIQFSAKLSF